MKAFFKEKGRLFILVKLFLYIFLSNTMFVIPEISSESTQWNLLILAKNPSIQSSITHKRRVLRKNRARFFLLHTYFTPCFTWLFVKIMSNIFYIKSIFNYNSFMENIESIGKEIKDRRLSLNLRMEDVARKAKITRSTLYSLEKGKGNISFRSLIGVLDVLGLSLSIKTQDTKEPNRNRASRRTTVLDKKINRFVIMCVEQYALYARKRSKDVYLELKRNGIIDELENDYEDLHGMSTTYLNDYIDSILGGNCS